MAKANSYRIWFHFLVAPFFFPERTQVKRFLTLQLKRGGRSIDAINIIFCDDEYLLSINRQYLKHNTYTDIITFDLSKKDKPLIADIFISIPRVRENARLFSTSFQRELHRVIFHGALHLIGFTDKTDAEIQGMRSEENAWLNQYFVSRGTSRKY